MVSKLSTASLVGVEAFLVHVEVERSDGLPVFSIIGLGDTAVQEARYRIQVALRGLNIVLPRRRTTINLGPASLRKDGAALDLPMALGVLAEAKEIPESSLDALLAVGELSLTGDLRPVRGVLSIAEKAKQWGFSTLVVPEANAREASSIKELCVIAPKNLKALLSHLRKETLLPRFESKVVANDDVLKSQSPLDFEDVHGQLQARRALEIAAVGQHNVLMIGSPGAGKTMLAQRLPGILPPLNQQQQIDATKIWSAAGMIAADLGLIEYPSFRSPHHTISQAGLVGGGSSIRPGEISLAHHGVLFLDELPELPRHLLSALRQPIEDRVVTIARARQVVQMPADFMLIAAANPCPCGWFGDPADRCRCHTEEISRYSRRMSGPLLDRIDLIIHMTNTSPTDLLDPCPGENSSNILKRVLAARDHGKSRGTASNASCRGRKLRAVSKLKAAAKKTLLNAASRLQLTGRGLERTLRVARSIADLNHHDDIQEEDIFEALSYRLPATLAGKESSSSQRV